MRVFEVLQSFHNTQNLLAPIDFTKPLTLRTLNRAKISLRLAAVEARNRTYFLATMYGDGVPNEPAGLDVMKFEKTQLDLERKRIGLRIDRLRLAGKMSEASEHNQCGSRRLSGP